MKNTFVLDYFGAFLTKIAIELRKEKEEDDTQQRSNLNHRYYMRVVCILGHVPNCFKKLYVTNYPFPCDFDIKFK